MKETPKFAKMTNQGRRGGDRAVSCPLTSAWPLLAGWRRARGTGPGSEGVQSEAHVGRPGMLGSRPRARPARGARSARGEEGAHLLVLVGAHRARSLSGRPRSPLRGESEHSGPEARASPFRASVAGWGSTLFSSGRAKITRSPCQREAGDIEAWARGRAT